MVLRLVPKRAIITVLIAYFVITYYSNTIFLNATVQYYLKPIHLERLLMYSFRAQSPESNFSIILTILLPFKLYLLVTVVAPPEASCYRVILVEICSPLNNSTTSKMLSCDLPATRFILACHPSTWLFMCGPSTLW